MRGGAWRCGWLTGSGQLMIAREQGCRPGFRLAKTLSKKWRLRADFLFLYRLHAVPHRTSSCCPLVPIPSIDQVPPLPRSSSGLTPLLYATCDGRCCGAGGKQALSPPNPSETTYPSPKAHLPRQSPKHSRTFAGLSFRVLLPVVRELPGLLIFPPLSRTFLKAQQQRTALYHVLQPPR